MKVCAFVPNGEAMGSAKVGSVEAEKVVELEHARSMWDLFHLKPGDLEEMRTGVSYALDSVSLVAPLSRPGKIVAAIVNTRGMLGGDLSLERPRLDMKVPSTIIGPGQVIRAPKSGIRPEVELAAIVGRRLTRASEDQAREGIFGYTILNDVTAPADSRDDAYEAYRRDRDTGVIAKKTLRGPLFRSKNHDTFCPMGPWVVTSDELSETESLAMKTTFERTSVQDGSTAEYIFKPAEIASYVSEFLTLEPGDVISCGSVGWTEEAIGKLDPTEYVLPKKRGVLSLEIEGIGVLSNPVEWY